MLERNEKPTPEVVQHLDRCLSCLSCMTTCPSGVNYMHLIDHARSHIEKNYRRPLADRVLRSVLGVVIPNAKIFELLVQLGTPFRRPLLWFASATRSKRLASMIRLLPQSTPRRSLMTRGATKPSQVSRGRVALLTGCAQRVLRPEINDAAANLLTRNGFEVIPSTAGCCGALVHHLGHENDAATAARRNIDAWIAEIEGSGLEAIIITASGCGTVVKDYHHILRDDLLYLEKARRVTRIVYDISEFIDKIGLIFTNQNTVSNLRVAYHSACSLQHGQKVNDAPKRILTAAGFSVKDVPEGHLCCGSAGTYNILQPKIADRLKARKVANIESTGSDVVATGNIGCITHLSTTLSVPIVHTVELLNWAAGGEIPNELKVKP